jgi:hypothetical protein
LCHICSRIAPGSQQTTMAAWCCAELLGPVTSSVRRTGSKECSMHASIDAERMEEQVEGAAHHHPPVGVSSVSRDHFLFCPCHSRVRRRMRPPSGRVYARGVWAYTRPLGAFVRPPQREREGQNKMNAFCSNPHGTEPPPSRRVPALGGPNPDKISRIVSGPDGVPR